MPSGIRKRRAMRSGEAPKKRRARTKPTKSIDVQANPVIAENWDPNQTLSQNYRRLGLASKLQKPAGGIEKNTEMTGIKTRTPSVQEGRIVRLPDGTTKIEYKQTPGSEEQEDMHETTEVVRKLEEYASTSRAKPRHLSEREVEWLTDLVQKHGTDYTAMQWDRKLNKFQHSAGELRKRIAKLPAGSI